jgi:hypothetical protein
MRMPLDNFDIELCSVSVEPERLFWAFNDATLVLILSMVLLLRRLWWWPRYLLFGPAQKSLKGHPRDPNHAVSDENQRLGASPNVWWRLLSYSLCFFCSRCSLALPRVRDQRCLASAALAGASRVVVA